MSPEELDNLEEIEGFAAGFYRRTSVLPVPSQLDRVSSPLIRTSSTSFQIRKFKPVEISKLPIFRPKLGFIDISYEWGTGAQDLDTRTTFLSGSVGWNYANTAAYMEWSGDNTGSGPELVTVDAGKALDENKWTNSVQIDCEAGWYIPAGGSGGATLKVTSRETGQMLQKAISPGQQDQGANTHVGTIKVYPDGSIELT